MTQTRAPIPTIEPSETSGTVQLLIADSGNRSAIAGMLDEQFDVETNQTVTDADLYLIEDHLFAEYRAALRERIDQEHPTFCPVVLIRRESTNLRREGVDPSVSDGGVRYDEVVDAPINPPQLIRRLRSLLVRRRQSQELMEQVSTLEAREQRLRRFEQGVESTGNGIVMTDSEGTIEYVNPALESIAGYTEDDVLGEPPQILIPAGSKEVFDEEFWRTLGDQAEWQGDIIIEGKDSHRLVVNATATALRDAENEIEGFVIVLSDVTERIQREQDLEAREEELDLLRQILTRYLRHNLRNNLNVIQGNAELLRVDETLSPTQIELAETIIDKTEDLIEKSDTARTYSRLLNREDELSTLDLSEMTTNAVQTVRESFPDVEFEIEAHETCDIRAREDTQLAFEELLDNAARHNDATDPLVRIQVCDRDGARVVIEDNGPGISDLERDALNSGTETQLSHSQGVGLWLSKWLIEGVDGALSIEQIDSGTRVLADFPPTAAVGSTGLEVTTLKERERRLQTITDRMADAIIEVDADWSVSVLDGQAEDMLDIDAGTVVGRSLWDVFSDLRDTQFETAVRNVMESRSSRTVEEYFAEIDAWLEFNVYPEFDGGLSFYTRDVTERKERERRYNAIFNQTYQFTGLLEPDGTVIEANETALKFDGLDRDDVVGEPFWETGWWQIDETTKQELREAIDRAATGEFVRYEVELQGEDETAIVDFSIRPITDEQGTVTKLIPEARDITEKRVQERKREQIIDQVTEAIVEVDSDWQFTLVNEQAEALYGIDEESLLDQSFWNVFEDARDTTFEEEYRGVMESRESTSFVEYFPQLDGWFDIKAYPKDDGGIAFYFVEVTEQYERKRDLEQANEFLLTLFETIPVGVTVLDTEGRITRANGFAKEELGLVESEITTRTYDDPEWEIYGKDGDPIPAEELPFSQVMETGETVIDYEHGISLPDGSKRWLSVNAAPITGKDGAIEKVVAVIKDLTDQPEYQERLDAETSHTNG